MRREDRDFGRLAGMTRRLRIDDLFALATPSEPALSPDGRRIVYVLETIDRDADEYRSSLWTVDADGGEPMRLTHADRDCRDSAPAWSPDGSTVAFLCDTGDGRADVWLTPPDSDAGARRLAALPAGCGRPVWSPDGASIAVSAPVGAGTGDAITPLVVDRLGYKVDGVGLVRNRRHIHVLDARTGSVRVLTSGDWDAGDPAWSPDGRQIAFPAGAAAEADLTLSSEVYVIDAERPGPPRLVGDAGGVAGPVCWMPDGKALLVVGHRTTATGNAGLLCVPLDGGETRDLMAAFDRNVMPGAVAYPGGRPAVVDDGPAVVVCVRDRGCTHVWRVDVEHGTRLPLVADPRTVVSGLSVAAGRAAVVVADPSSFGEIAVVGVDGGELRRLTSHTGDSLPDVDLFVPEEREFTAPDGTTVHGWVVRDPAAPSPAPLVLDVHGGPHNAWHPAADSAHLYHQLLAARGVAVAIPNPRGSDGYGDKFFTAVLGGWGVADEADLLSVVDQLVADGTADPARLGVCGYSYGGFMSCYLTGRTHRFAAAVAGGVVADLTSMAGTSDEAQDLATIEWRGRPYDNVEALREQSPIERVGNVETPTLILHGLADHTCPVGQAEQWFTALRQRGVPAQMVLYPGASHVFVVEGRPSHRADYNTRLTDWMVEHLQSPPRGNRTSRAPGHWQRRLATLAETHGVPGATLGILRVRPDGDGELTEAAFGVLNTATGVAATTDSLFQIGSITKVWTATVIMQLVDEGRLDLDAPVVDILPELRLANGELTKRVTMRHLLTHTSGIDGDIFDDTGRGDDCLERYVAGLGAAAVNHPLGMTFSYCNTGYVIAGRVIEVLTGQTWDDAMRERLFEPLHLTHTCTLPDEALRHRTAIGHLAEPGEAPHIARAWGLPRSAGPAGLICSTVADVLAFGRMHLTGGLAPDGAAVLSPASVALMQDKHADLPDRYTLGDSWGLGWIRYDWGGQRLVGHDGGTIGQAAFLRVLPEQDLAVCLLTNGGQAHDLYHDLVGEVVAELAGVTMAPGIQPAAAPPNVDLVDHVGTYERTSSRTEIIERAGTLVLRSTVTGPIAELVDEPTHEYDLVPVDDGLFAMREPNEANWRAVTFYRLADGTPYVHYGARATPKVG